MLPELVDGVLPDGVHLCTIDDVDAVFGRFWRTDRRIHLTAKLREYLEEARRSGIIAAVVIDGSYASVKAQPSDVDLVVAYRKDFDLRQELRPFEYNVQSKRMIRQQFRFDARMAVDESEAYLEAVRWFSQVKPDEPEPYTSRPTKGLARINL